MRLATLQILMILALFSSASWAASDQTFELSQEAFIADAFNGQVPKSQRVWIRSELKDQIEIILQHNVSFLRTEYWLKDKLSVWILDEIGKEKPITVGIVVELENGISQIKRLKVLSFRESRGWEVKNTFFTDQFTGTKRDSQKGKSRLEPTINGITGATLSVRALKKTAEIALMLDKHVRKTND